MIIFIAAKHTKKIQLSAGDTSMKSISQVPLGERVRERERAKARCTMDSEQRSTATELKPVEFATFILMWATHVRTGTTATTVGQCQPPTKHWLPPTVAHCAVAPAMLAGFKLKRPCALWVWLSGNCLQALLALHASTACLSILHARLALLVCLPANNNLHCSCTACKACLALYCLACSFQSSINCLLCTQLQAVCYNKECALPL